MPYKPSIGFTAVKNTAFLPLLRLFPSDFLMNVLELLEGTRIDWKSLDSRNIEIFSSLLSLLPVLISNLQVTIVEYRRTSPSCTLP